MNKMFVAVIAVCMLWVPLSGQIVINWNEIPHTLGTTWDENDQDSVTVDLGSTGGPQNWNFTAQPMGDDSNRVTIVSPSSAPFVDSFPSLNLVYKSLADSDTNYQYYELATNHLATLGLAGCTPDTTWLFKYDPADSAPLPLTYGANRNFYYEYVVELSPPMSMSYEHYGRQVIDAYGTVTIPYGTFECLRVCDFDTCVMIMYNNSVPFFWDTTTHIKHAFVAENRAAVVCVKSYPGETDPNYSAALCLQRLTNYSAGIQSEKREHIAAISLNRTVFSDFTVLRYTLAQSSHVEVCIFDAKGSLVSTIVDTPQDAGVHAVTWRGKNSGGDKVPDGIYFICLRTHGKDFIEKAVFVR